MPDLRTVKIGDLYRESRRLLMQSRDNAALAIYMLEGGHPDYARRAIAESTAQANDAATVLAQLAQKWPDTWQPEEVP